MSTKLCPKCNETKPFNEFYKNRTKPDGCSVYCRACIVKWYYDKEADRRREVRMARPVEVRNLGRGSLVEDGRKTCSVCGETKEATNQFFGYMKTGKDGFNPVCRLCYRTKYQAAKAQWFQNQDPKAVRSEDTAKIREWRLKIKQEMLDAYGRKCVCCGVREEEFLTLDHIGGRNEINHPWKAKAGAAIYSKLKKLGWPKDYRLLCMNCNWAVRAGGICPHERQRLAEGVDG